MSSKLIGKVIGLLGTLFLAHSAYSTYEHLAYLNAIDDNTASLPVDIVLECLLSALVTLVGVIFAAAPFKDIALEVEMSKMSIDKVDTKPSFITFNHRQVVSTHSQLDRKFA